MTEQGPARTRNRFDTAEMTRSEDDFDVVGMARARPTRRRFAATAVCLCLLVGIFGALLAQRAQGQGANEGTAKALLDDLASLDGTGNNLNEPTLGSAGQIYPRVGEANYADGVEEMLDRPAERYVSNRIFNDSNQNVFSENGVTHWGFVWGQFIDHTIGFRAESGEELFISFDPTDPLEEFDNDLGAMRTTRSAAAPGTGTDIPREQINTVSSYIDGWAIYGGSADRLDWLRRGPLDGDPTNNDALFITDDGYLPTALARPGAVAPAMELNGRLLGDPSAAIVAGDMRANENLGLTAVQTLFVREHNRIVEKLPPGLDEESKFQVARRLIIALQQYITYNEFLPAMGVDLPPYRGYDDSVDPSVTNEFATVGYRAHSHVHGEFETEIALSDSDDGDIEAFEEAGISVEKGDDAIEIAIPLNVGFANPSLLPDVGLGNLLVGLSGEAAYANDEQIDNQLRSVLFQIPGPDTDNPLDCLDGEAIADCFVAVNDLGALDIVRSFDHGMPNYNDMRQAFGLEPVTSFAEMTGEDTEAFPEGMHIDDPSILNFVMLADGEGNELDPGSDEAEGETIVAIRATTTAARLNAIFGEVDAVDAFTGMVSEPHVPGAEFGELQLAIWTDQFVALRDGDRFFYDNDEVLAQVVEAYGIRFDRTLAEVIAANTAADLKVLSPHMFLIPELQEEADDD